LKKDGTLFARCSLEPYTRLNNHGYLILDTLTQVTMGIGCYNDAEVGDRNAVGIDWIVGLRQGASSCHVEYELMTKKIEIYPVITGSSCLTTQNIAIKKTGELQVLGRQR